MRRPQADRARRGDRGIAVTAGMLALAILVHAAPAARGQLTEATFVEPFGHGSNVGAWQWLGIGTPTMPATGGNPGAYVTKVVQSSPSALVGTFAGGTPFTGDFRGTHVVSMGVDFATFLTQENLLHPDFEVTFMLVNDSGTPGNALDDTWYYYGTGLQPPLVGEGWISFDVPVPSQSQTTPPGWVLADHPFFPSSDDPLSWPELMADVSFVRIGYSDPIKIFAIHNWGVGADNPRITRLQGSAFEDLGSGLAGVSGVPSLVGESVLLAGADVTVTLTDARPSAPAFLFLGLDALDFSPFYGGTLVPDFTVPPGQIIVVPTDAGGVVELSTTWPAGIPSGLQLYLQWWIDDPAGPFGFAASNAIKGTAP